MAPRKNNAATETTTNATMTETTEAKKTTRRTTKKPAAVLAPIPEPVQPEPEKAIDYSPMGKVNGWVSARQRTVRAFEELNAKIAWYTLGGFIGGLAIGISLAQYLIG